MPICCHELGDISSVNISQHLLRHSVRQVLQLCQDVPVEDASSSCMAPVLAETSCAFFASKRALLIASPNTLGSRLPCCDQSIEQMACRQEPLGAAQPVHLIHASGVSDIL